MILPAICLYVFIGIQLWVAAYVNLLLKRAFKNRMEHFGGIIALLLFIPFWPAFLMRGALK